MQSPLSDIITPRLILRLMSREVITSILEGELSKAEDLLNAAIPAEISASPGGLIYNLKQLDADSLYVPWSARAIVLKDGLQMVGFTRFHSSPDPVDLQAYARNAVEIGYRIFSKYRRNNYATEAAGAMMDWATIHYNIHHFVASVAPGNIASNKMVTSFGFTKVAEVIDREDGIEHVFLRVADINKQNV